MYIGTRREEVMTVTVCALGNKKISLTSNRWNSRAIPSQNANGCLWQSIETVAQNGQAEKQIHLMQICSKVEQSKGKLPGASKSHALKRQITRNILVRLWSCAVAWAPFARMFPSRYIAEGEI
jgi:hypothetical protein